MGKSSKLGTRILTFVIITFVIAITLIMGVTVYQINVYSDKNCEQQANVGVSVLNSKVEDIKMETASIVGFAAVDKEIAAAMKAGKTDDISASAAELQQSSGADFIIFTDALGAVLASAGLQNSLTDYSSNPNIGSALSGNTVTTIESDFVAHISAVTAIPVRNEKNEIIGTVTVGDVLDKEQLVDDLKTLCYTDFTIFFGDTRVNTTIVKDGQRQIGTKLSSAVADIVIKQGQAYNGHAEIVGSQYICAYLPLKNSSNEVIGVLFSGQPLAEAQALTNNTIMLAGAFSLFAILFIAVEMIIYLRRVLSNPLKKVIEASQKMADGDLTVSIDIKSKNEVGTLAKSFSDMAEKLRYLITGVNDSAKQIATASHEIADSSTSLSQGAVEQAASVEQLSSSLEEVLNMTKNNSQMADNASSLSEAAKNKCTESNDSMQNLLSAMTEIRHSSDNISRIIKVINEIAFQTNILSLNAAVEASQAGQYGKGFAVVAENVKQLANRSASAANEIADMIEESAKLSRSGSEMATVTADKLSEVLEQINEMNSLITKISVSSEEQTSGISQINNGIGQISNVLQTNSALSEQSSASSVELSAQAKALEDQVEVFKLDQ